MVNLSHNYRNFNANRCWQNLFNTPWSHLLDTLILIFKPEPLISVICISYNFLQILTIRFFSKKEKSAMNLVLKISTLESFSFCSNGNNGPPDAYQTIWLFHLRLRKDDVLEIIVVIMGHKSHKTHLCIESTGILSIQLLCSGNQAFGLSSVELINT